MIAAALMALGAAPLQYDDAIAAAVIIRAGHVYEIGGLIADVPTQGGGGNPGGGGGPGCSVSVTPTADIVGASAQVMAVTINADENCQWSTSSLVTWISVVSATGVGADTVNYSVSANDTGTSRSGEIIIGGVTVTITQARVTDPLDPLVGAFIVALGSPTVAQAPEPADWWVRPNQTTDALLNVHDPVTLAPLRGLWHFDEAQGSYSVTRIVNGQPQTATFTPATLIQPRIAVEIRRHDDEFFFRYTIESASGSKQPIRACSFIVADASIVASTPMEWDSMSTPSRGRIAWVKLNRGGSSLGVEPGESLTGYEIRSTSLPGIAIAECRGRIADLVIPEWLDDDERRELDLLVQRDFVAVPVIAPAIPIGQTETADTLLATIRRHYSRELELLPDAQGKVDLTGLLSIELAIQRGQYASAIMTINELLSAPLPSEAWPSQVIRGLRASLLYVREHLR